MNIASSIHTLELYADCAPNTAFLKLTDNGLECIKVENMNAWQHVKKTLHAGAYKDRKIADFVNSKEFCTAVLWSKTKNVEKLKAVAEAFNFVNLKAVLNKKVERIALTSFEKHVIAKLAPEISPKEVIECEIAAIKDLDLNDQTKHATVQVAKRKGLLTACHPQNVGAWLGKLEACEALYIEAEKLLPRLDAPKQRKIPDLAHQDLQKQLRDMVQRGINTMLDEMLEDPTAAEDFLDRTQEHLDNCKAFLEPQYRFYEKWGEYLTTEMMQGFIDPNETLDIGVCWSLAMRWTIAELEHPRPDELNTAITARDRFEKAFVSATALKHNDPDANKVKGKHGITNTHTYEWGVDVKEKELKNMLRQQLESRQFANHGGAGQLAFWYKNLGHTISVAFQPQDQHYRIGDPNRGIFQLPDATTTIDFLTDLMHTFYSKEFKKVRCYCFDTA